MIGSPFSSQGISDITISTRHVRLMIALLFVGVAAPPTPFGALDKVALPQVKAHARLLQSINGYTPPTCVTPCPAHYFIRPPPPAPPTPSPAPCPPGYSWDGWDVFPSCKPVTPMGQSRPPPAPSRPPSFPALKLIYSGTCAHYIDPFYPNGCASACTASEWSAHMVSHVDRILIPELTHRFNWNLTDAAIQTAITNFNALKNCPIPTAPPCSTMPSFCGNLLTVCLPYAHCAVGTRDAACSNAPSSCFIGAGFEVFSFAQVLAYCMQYARCTTPPAVSSPPPPSPPPPSPSPPPVAESQTPIVDADAGGNPCFPSEALVTMADGTPHRLDALRAGDAIVAARADGTLTTDTVSTLSLADAYVQGTTFVVLTTASGRNLTLTPTHHVPVGAACCADLKQAKDVVVGETVYEAVSTSAAVRATQVQKIGRATKPGLHSPVLSHGTMPIVNGVATSFDALHNVRLASYNASYGLPCMQDVLTTQRLVPQVRLASYGLPLLEAAGLTATFRDAFLGTHRKYIA
jgi:hypothetical protein